VNVTFEVPDGELCGNCQFLRDFEVEEIETTTHDCVSPKYIRNLKASCYLFRKFVRGSSFSYMNKCSDCLRNGESHD